MKQNGTTIQTATVAGNESICREHYRMTLRVPELPAAHPGQFLHINPDVPAAAEYRTFGRGDDGPDSDWIVECKSPLLRRAFSIAGLLRSESSVEVDLIYRVVGTATQWMKALRDGDRVSMLAPVGNRFPISDDKPTAWLVAGGVGLPPMLWLAKSLAENGKGTVAFCGSQSSELLALSLDAAVPPAADAGRASYSAREFTDCGVPVVISTDDGSLGFSGHVGAAMTAYHQANPTPGGDLVVYTCGPERMMQFVAGYCADRGIECYACMERSMACGMGTCQSCVVPVRNESDEQGWSYRLCCTEGPVFNAREIIWEPMSIS